MSETVPIPEPAGLPFLGNINAIDPEFPLGSMTALADQYGKPASHSYFSYFSMTSL